MSDEIEKVMEILKRAAVSRPKRNVWKPVAVISTTALVFLLAFAIWSNLPKVPPEGEVADQVTRILAGSGPSYSCGYLHGANVKLTSRGIASGNIDVTCFFMPYRASKRLDEIKMYCTAKLKQLYEELPWLKECSFTIKCPYHSRPGGPIEWRQEVRFKFDRSLYEKIDWGKFFYADILKVAEDVEF
ncbi:hypothetical protein [Acetomicrobium mobile]|uniref:hypothetical protein n=1 Tax=Acetomicrobium mobile TaxID=97477 RepID=UPI0026F13D4A|nr:hypothetical protein [Acetomicrobium mobile]